MSISEEEICETIILQRNEKILRYLHGSYGKPEKSMKGDYQVFTFGGHRGRKYREKSEEKIQSGYFILTNFRIAWLQTRGLIKKALYNTMSMSIGDIVSIVKGGVLMRHIAITDASGREHKFYVKELHDGKAFKEFKKQILELQIK